MLLEFLKMMLFVRIFGATGFVTVFLLVCWIFPTITFRSFMAFVAVLALGAALLGITILGSF